MFESCVEIRAHFSDYLDGRCDRTALRSLRYHLNYCGACRAELDRYQTVQGELCMLLRRRVPPELGLRLRVRMSQEIHRNLLGRLWVRVENSLQPLLLPASGGLLAAAICFVLIMGSHVRPATSMPDVPFQVRTPPRLRELAPFNLPSDNHAVVVLMRVDACGRVLGYQVLSGQESPEFMYHLDRAIYFSLFDPATTSGKPTDGEVILSLRRITVRG